MKMLDGKASSTLNPFGGTQASNLVGMRDLDGAGGLGAGVGGAGGPVLNMGGYQGLGSLYGAYGAYGAGVGGGPLLLASQEGQGLVQGEATRSMNELGRQLGECYLARDLACLLTQQRDMELQNKAEQTVLNQGDKRREPKFLQGPPKLEAASRCKSMIVSHEALRSNRQSDRLTPIAAEKSVAEPSRQPILSSDCPRSSDDFSRALILNILALLLEAYPAPQLRLLNLSLPLRSLISFMQSKAFQLPVMEQAVEASR